MTPDLQARFTRSIYITLGIACLALGYAEYAFLPEVGIVLGLVSLLLIAAYRLEGRWALTIPAANALGGVIAIITVGWIAYQFARPSGTLFDVLPWPTSLLPYFGPLLLVLVPAKLFRPKHQGDFWAMHVVGLMAMALGCALAGDGIFGLLMLAYLVAAFWSLALFWAYRRGQPAPAGPLLRRAMVWAVALNALAVALFLVTPRLDESRWQLALRSGRLLTGYNEERPNIDLHSEGLLRTNHDLVFEVTATDNAGQPKLDLSPATRWRGTTFNRYANGRWEPGAWFPPLNFVPGPAVRHMSPPLTQEPERLPDLGPDQFFLTYRLATRLPTSFFLAEPVCVGTVRKGPRREVPVQMELEGNDQLWFSGRHGEVVPPDLPHYGGRMRYRQVVRPPTEPNLGSRLEVEDGFRRHLTELPDLPRLRQFAAELIDTMVTQQRLPAEVRTERDPDTGLPARRFHERIARAFEAHLATSGEYVYSLQLDRLENEAGWDPVEEFLIRSKQGHCNRFSTALALLLRSQAIPSRVVLGFRGCENNGDGTYDIRQSDAHSWVETVVERQGDKGPELHWLTLDGTPLYEVSDTGAAGFDQWWQLLRGGLSNAYRTFVVDYNDEQQTAARVTLAKAGAAGANKLGRGVLIAAWLAFSGLTALALWRRRVRSQATGPLARQLERIARRAGIVVRASDTPAEIADRLSALLQARGASAEVCALPGVWAEHHYAARYGGRAIDTRRLLAEGAAMQILNVTHERVSAPSLTGKRV